MFCMEPLQECVAVTGSGLASMTRNVKVICSNVYFAGSLILLKLKCKDWLFQVYLRFQVSSLFKFIQKY